MPARYERVTPAQYSQVSAHQVAAERCPPPSCALSRLFAPRPSPSSLKRPLQGALGCGNGSQRAASHSRCQRSVLVLPFPGGHPLPGALILHPLEEMSKWYKNESVQPRGGAVPTLIPLFSPTTSPIVPIAWQTMVTVVTTDPLLPKLEDSTPHATGRPSLDNGPSAAGTDP